MYGYQSIVYQRLYRYNWRHEMTNMRKTSNSSDRPTLSALDKIMGRPEVKRRVDAAARRLTRKLGSEPKAQMAWETVPLSVYDPGLPETIRSSWVFILRGGAVTGAERHPN